MGMLVLPATLTADQAQDTLRLLAQGLRSVSDESVPIDASGLAEFDSSALAVLLECQRLAQAAGKSIDVRQSPPTLQALARLYGVQDLLLSGADGTAVPQPAT